MPEWCTGIPALVHWAAIAMLCIAAGGFALLALRACVCVCVNVGIMISMVNDNMTSLISG